MDEMVRTLQFSAFRRKSRVSNKEENCARDRLADAALPAFFGQVQGGFKNLWPFVKAEIPAAAGQIHKTD